MAGSGRTVTVCARSFSRLVLLIYRLVMWQKKAATLDGVTALHKGKNQVSFWFVFYGCAKELRWGFFSLQELL